VDAAHESRSPLVIAGSRALVVVAVVLAAAAWALFANRVLSAKPVPHIDVPQPNAVVWHGGVYQSRARLASYLHRNGRTYEAWARSHPGAAALLVRLDTGKKSH
jgi:hypothetical protein